MDRSEKAAALAGLDCMLPGEPLSSRGVVDIDSEPMLCTDQRLGYVFDGVLRARSWCACRGACGLDAPQWPGVDADDSPRRGAEERPQLTDLLTPVSLESTAASSSSMPETVERRSPGARRRARTPVLAQASDAARLTFAPRRAPDSCTCALGPSRSSGIASVYPVYRRQAKNSG